MLSIISKVADYLYQNPALMIALIISAMWLGLSHTELLWEEEIEEA